MDIIPPENGNGDLEPYLLGLIIIILSIVAIVSAIMIWQFSKRKKKELTD